MAMQKATLRFRGGTCIACKKLGRGRHVPLAPGSYTDEQLSQDTFSVFETSGVDDTDMMYKSVSISRSVYATYLSCFGHRFHSQECAA